MELSVTNKQLEVLKLRSEGFENKEISALLHISHNAVASRIKYLCQVLDAKNIAQAITKGVERGIIGVDHEHIIAIQIMNEKINELGLSEIAHVYLINRFGLDVFSQSPSKEEATEYLDYMTKLIEKVEKGDLS